MVGTSRCVLRGDCNMSDAADDVADIDCCCCCENDKDDGDVDEDGMVMDVRSTVS